MLLFNGTKKSSLIFRVEWFAGIFYEVKEIWEFEHELMIASKNSLYTSFFRRQRARDSILLYSHEIARSPSYFVCRLRSLSFDAVCLSTPLKNKHLFLLFLPQKWFVLNEIKSINQVHSLI